MATDIKGDTALLDAHFREKDTFSKIRLFEFRDKPGRNLARILSGNPQKNFIPPMR